MTLERERETEKAKEKCRERERDREGEWREVGNKLVHYLEFIIVLK